MPAPPGGRGARDDSGQASADYRAMGRIANTPTTMRTTGS